MNRLSVCPLCGSKRMRHVRAPLILRIRGKEYRIDAVPRDKCFSCGQVFLDPDAGEKIDSVIFRPRRLAA